MKRYQVIFTERAQRDLQEIARYIADHSSPHRAMKYVQALKDTCAGLALVPSRGTLLSGRHAGMRFISYKHSAAIYFRVGETTVSIAAVFYRGRDHKRHL